MQPSFLGKKYILKKSENFDAYMKELGVGLTLRKMGNTIVSQCLLNKSNDDVYTFTLETPYRNATIHFKLERPFTEVTIDNRVVRTICKLDGNTFVQEQQATGFKPTKIVREYRNNGDELITTLLVGDVKAVRFYEVTIEIPPEVSKEDPEAAKENPEATKENPEVSNEIPEATNEIPEAPKENPEAPKENPEAPKESPEE